MSKTIFLDTNIYLHYNDFDQIDWASVIGAANIMILVPPITIRELNKHKDLNSNKRIKDRAAHIQKKLHALFKASNQGQIKDKLTIVLEDREPPIDFAYYQLNREIQDDQLIASVITYRNENPDQEVLLITSDSGLILIGKARRLSITTLNLPDNLKLPAAVDPEQKEIQELKSQLLEYQNRIPDLKLVFAGNVGFVTHSLIPSTELTAENLRSQIEQIKRSFPKKGTDVGLDNPDLTRRELKELEHAMSAAKNILDESVFDVSAYNHELEQFYKQQEAYLQEAAKFNNLKKRTIKIDICLTNIGTLPAEDVDVSLHFPDGFELMRESRFPKSPKEPKVPIVKSHSARILESFNFSSPLSDIHALLPRSIGNQPPPNVSNPRITRTKSYDVKFHVGRIKHQTSECIEESLLIVFDTFESADSFSIDYKINAGNVPKETNGKLNVIIKKSSV